MVIIIQVSFGLTVSDDPTFNIGFVTSAIETNLAIITASAPALRPILRTRDRGGWLPSFGRTVDVEMASADPYSLTSSRGGRGGSGKLTRSGSRGGRRGGRRGSRRGRGGLKAVAVKDMRNRTERELRSYSPRSSEEEAMTNNGIMRVSDIQREIDGIVKDMAIGPGSYGSDGRESTGSRGGGGVGVAVSRRYPERYYSESVYPDAEYGGGRDLHEERLSRYGEKRFGVVTPKSTGPRWDDNGRPF